MTETAVAVSPPILEARGVHRVYGSRSGTDVRALAGVDVAVHAGRPVGIAGESGSGKSTLLRLLLALEPPSEGDVTFEGVAVDEFNHERKRHFRRSIQAVFQDPGSSFDPRHRIWRLVTEPAWVTEGLSTPQRKDLAAELLASVDLPRHHLTRFPHQLSGGERQRVAVARALSSKPSVILLDEPVTSLDISVRGYVINMLMRKARDEAVTYVVVSHDLAAIFHLTDYLYVMYEGVVVEEGPTIEVITGPLHPYTQALVAAVENPLASTDEERGVSAPPGACPYVHRCPYAEARCQALPQLSEVQADRLVRCVLHQPANEPVATQARQP